MLTNCITVLQLQWYLTNKKAVLSQRWPRNAPYAWVPENFRDSLTTPTATIPNIFHGLLFRSTLWMFLQNLKSVALSIPQIIRDTPKIWTVPGYALAPFSRKFLIGFYSDWPYNCTAKFVVRSFTRSRDNRGYPKNFGNLWIRPRSILSKIFNGLLFEFAL